jgi:TRAP-type C4-dicarboxylate transport system permease small subunit
MRSILNFLDHIYRIAGILAGIALVFLLVLVLYSIVARMFGLFAGGATDFAGYVMAASSFLALAYTFRGNGHIRVQLLIQAMTGGRRRAVEIFCLAIMSAATAFVAFYMSRLALESYEFGERSEGADAVLLWIPQTPVAIGAILLAVAVIHTLLLALFDYDAINPDEQGSEGPNEI